MFTINRNLNGKAAACITLFLLLFMPLSIAYGTAIGGISGQVVNTDGEPLAGVTVSLSEEWWNVAQTTTDADGMYSFAIAPGNYYVSMYDETRIYPRTFHDGASYIWNASMVTLAGDEVLDVPIVAQVGGRLVGTVTNANGVLPIAEWTSVQINVLNPNGSWAWVNNAVLDENGQYEITGIAAGSYHVTVSNSEGRNAATIEDVVMAFDTTTTLDIQYDPPSPELAMFTGRVTDIAGNPLESIPVFLYNPEINLFYVSQTYTDADGNYVIGNVQAGEYSLSAGGDSTYATLYSGGVYNAREAEKITVEPGESASVDFVLEGGGTIVGSVTVDGNAPDWFTIDVCTYETYYGGVERYWMCRSTLTVEDESNYTISGLAPQSYRIQVNAHVGNNTYQQFYGGAENVDSAADIPIQLGETQRVDFSIDAQTGIITGQVTDEMGTPLANIEVTLWKIGSLSRYSELTDATGHYTFTVVGGNEREYRLSFEDPAGQYVSDSYGGSSDYTGFTVNVAETVVVDNALTAGSQLVGTISFAGLPVESASLYLSPASPDGTILDESSAENASSDEMGNYQFGGLVAGTYRFEYIFSAQGYNISVVNDAAELITIGENEQQTFDITYDEPNGALNGQITDVNGNSVPNAEVIIYSNLAYGGNAWHPIVTLTTDADGMYSVSGLVASDYRIRVEPTEGTAAATFYGNTNEPYSATPVILDYSAPSTADIILPEGGSISGNVSLDVDASDSDVDKLSNIAVTAYRYDSRYDYWFEYVTVMTDEMGDYVIERLVSDEYRISFTPSSPDFRMEYYDNAFDFDAQLISVGTGEQVTGIDAVLEQAAEPSLAVWDDEATVSVDPWSGHATILVDDVEQSDLTVAVDAGCGEGISATDTHLEMGGEMHELAWSEGETFTTTLPGTLFGTVVLPADLILHWSCDGQESSETVGEIALFDPSGFITDIETGAPIAGATVMLYRVPDWLPDTENETRNCRTTATRTGDDWSQEPAATIGLGVMLLDATRSGELLYTPTVNPQQTNADGYYGWDVAEGCWYVVVQAEGYETGISPVVGVPEAVSDLNLSLIPTNRNIPTAVDMVSAVSNPYQVIISIVLMTFHLGVATCIYYPVLREHWVA